MKREGLTPDEWCLIGLVLCIVVGIAGYAAGRSGGSSLVDGAAWFQAVFSVVAIGVAVWISRSDHRREARLSAEAETNSVIGVVVLINRAIAVIESLSRPGSGGVSEAAMHSLHVIAEKLESLDLITYPSPVLLRESLQAANNIRIYINDAKQGLRLDRRNLVGSMESESNRILAFYGLSENDLPKRRVGQPAGE